MLFGVLATLSISSKTNEPFSLQAAHGSTVTKGNVHDTTRTQTLIERRGRMTKIIIKLYAEHLTNSSKQGQKMYANNLYSHYKGKNSSV